MVDVFVGLGSNIDPARNLRQALEELSASFELAQISSVYRSPAYGFVGDHFLNMVVAFECDATPDAVEAELYRLEHKGGRRRKAGQLSARTLDLDLLLYGQMVDAARRLPRDDTLKYAFVLAPLAEIAPALVHPLTGAVMSAAWAEMSANDVALERLGDPSCLETLLPADAPAAVDS